MDLPTLTHRLRELLEALDRRVPRPGVTGEAGIAAESAALRQRAQDHLDTLTPPDEPPTLDADDPAHRVS